MFISDNYLEEYNPKLVSQWDTLVDWEHREKIEGSFFLELLESASANSVLDSATGTGFHSVVFANAGYDVYAVDGCPKMVEVAKDNFVKHNFESLPCSVGDWRQRETLPDKKFDAVVCLGNSLAHLFTREDLVSSLRTFYELLHNGGTLIIDHRNYDGVLAGDVDGSSKNYCCTGLHTNCELKLLSESTVEIIYTVGDEKPESIVTHAWKLEDMHSALREAGFVVSQVFGENGSPYSYTSSEFVVNIATKVES